MKPPRQPVSLAGQFLKRYRQQHHLTQEQLAALLHVEPRTIRAYETGERQLSNIHELRRIADWLGVPPEALGLAPQPLPRSPYELADLLQHAVQLIDVAEAARARAVIEQVLSTLSLPEQHDPSSLQMLARTYYVAAFVLLRTTTTREWERVLELYQQVEAIARQLQEPTLLHLALTYQGDIERRRGRLVQAAQYLEAAQTLPNVPDPVRGNGLQLLARVYLRRQDLQAFDSAMKQAEALAPAQLTQTLFDLPLRYSRGTVYEEYARSCADLGQSQLAFHYLDLAQHSLPATRFWELMLLTARIIVLVKAHEFDAGTSLALDLLPELKQKGLQRFLDRLHFVQRYLDQLQQQAGRASRSLADALAESAPDY
ncbi:helix-turn-helix domain-containing protein [Thermogemmatispora tikiterensis]|uniref:helix-turn-helix domain-containing protein n=1 Tax=Thermogemmatispora tikiterensis TaxID=1825093 RepID=UPI00167296C7|nr:helix-turn-helix domain-containing protein [Thermogemmatispora tikiterensis]